MRVQVRFSTLLVFLLLILPYQTSPQSHILTEQKIFDQFNPPVFEDITIKEGLPQNTVLCILQDYLGYLWIGTEYGLVQYDGYSMKVFQPEEYKSNSISNSSVLIIYEDKNKTLWIGTDGGLNKFDRVNESFKSYRYNPDDSTSINSDYISCIYEDKAGRFWIGTNKGLNKFDRDREIFTRYHFINRDLGSSSSPTQNKYNLSIKTIIEDPVSEDLLLGTGMMGLWKFNIKEKIFLKYKFISDSLFDKEIGFIQSFHKARDGKIWIASIHSLSRLDP